MSDVLCCSFRQNTGMIHLRCTLLRVFLIVIASPRIKRSFAGHINVCDPKYGGVTCESPAMCHVSADPEQTGRILECVCPNSDSWTLLEGVKCVRK